MNAVVKESAAAMDKLRARVVKYQEERRTKKYVFLDMFKFETRTKADIL